MFLEQRAAWTSELFICAITVPGNALASLLPTKPPAQLALLPILELGLLSLLLVEMVLSAVVYGVYSVTKVPNATMVALWLYGTVVAASIALATIRALRAASMTDVMGSNLPPPHHFSSA
jgi:hypothetical protein